MAGRRQHLERFAALIAYFVLPEIRLEITVHDADVVEIFTSKFGNSIRHVKIDAWSADYTLKCFSLPPSLKPFDFRGFNLHKLDPFWELVRDSLEDVVLLVPDLLGWLSCISRLRTHCRKLSSIHLMCPLEGLTVEEGDILELLCSYGEQLIHADLIGHGE